MKNEILVQNLNGLIELENKFTNYVDVKEKTMETYKSSLKFFNNYVVNNNIKNPTRENIIEYRDYLKSHYSVSTVQTCMIALRQFFKWLEYEGIYKNVTENVKGVVVSNQHKRKPLSLQQSKEFIARIDNVRDKALMALLITTGLRTIEVNRANIEDIKIVDGEALLYIQGKGKDEKDDYVKIDGYVLEYLLKSFKKRTSGPLFISESTNSYGKSLSTRSIRGIFKKWARILGFDDKMYSCHSTRHTFINTALELGMPLQEVSQQARHSSIHTTMIYVNELNKMKSTIEHDIAKNIFE